MYGKSSAVLIRTAKLPFRSERIPPDPLYSNLQGLLIQEIILSQQPVPEEKLQILCRLPDSLVQVTVVCPDQGAGRLGNKENAPRKYPYRSQIPGSADI